MPNGLLGGLTLLARRLKAAVSEIALQARGLNKRFGSLVVASDVDLVCLWARATR